MLISMIAGFLFGNYIVLAFCWRGIKKARAETLYFNPRQDN